jgi:hypothetical protein
MSEDYLSKEASRSGGMAFTWSSELSIEDVLAAADRRARYLAGGDIPGRQERRRRGSTPRGEAPGSASTAAPAPPDAADGLDAMLAGSGAPGDPLGDEFVLAALSDQGTSVSLAELAGHALVEPGPALAGWLSCAAPADLDDAGLVTSITSWRKVTSWAQAKELTAIAELARRRGASADAAEGQDPVRQPEAEFASSEVALALTLTQGGAESWMDLAVSMTRRLPGTTAALAAGIIDLARARLIEAFTTCLDDDLAGQVERRVLGKAEHQTTGQLRASLQRAVIAADPAAAERRRERAERNARVELFGDPEGTGSLAGRFLPAGHAAAAWSRICAMAKALESAGARGGIDLLRAQVFVGLLLGTLPIIPPPLDQPGDNSPGSGSGPDGDAGSGSAGNGGSWPDGDGGSGSAGDGGSWPDDRGNPGSGGDRPDGFAGDSGDSLDDSDMADVLWLLRQRDEGTTADRDDRIDPGGPDCGVNIREAGPPECRIRAGPLHHSWPEIPMPGTRPAPGCAPDPLSGIPPPGPVAAAGWARADDANGIRAGVSEAGVHQACGNEACGKEPCGNEACGIEAGKGQAKRRQARESALAGAMTLSVPLRTLAGLTGEPGQLGRLGAVTGDVARGLARAAAANPACEWKIIVIGRSGEAVAVTRLDKRTKTLSCAGPGCAGPGCAGHRSLGWVARIMLTVRAADLAAGALRVLAEPVGPAPLGHLLKAALESAMRAAQAAARAGLGMASPATAPSAPPVASPACCGHAGAVSGYRIPDSMRRLIEARDQTCRFPVCRLPACRTDMDHTIPYDLGGPTCRCNVSAECRHHHRLKQLRGWQLSQPQPGSLVWRTPARLTYPVEPDPHPA